MRRWLSNVGPVKPSIVKPVTPADANAACARRGRACARAHDDEARALRHACATARVRYLARALPCATRGRRCAGSLTSRRGMKLSHRPGPNFLSYIARLSTPDRSCSGVYSAHVSGPLSRYGRQCTCVRVLSAVQHAPARALRDAAASRRWQRAAALAARRRSQLRRQQPQGTQGGLRCEEASQLRPRAAAVGRGDPQPEAIASAAHAAAALSAPRPSAAAQPASAAREPCPCAQKHTGVGAALNAEASRHATGRGCRESCPTRASAKRCGYTCAPAPREPGGRKGGGAHRLRLPTKHHGLRRERGATGWVVGPAAA